MEFRTLAALNLREGTDVSEILGRFIIEMDARYFGNYICNSEDLF